MRVAAMRRPRKERKFRRLGRNVFHDIDQDRSGPPGRRDRERFADHVGELPNIAYLIVAFS